MATSSPAVRLARTPLPLASTSRSKDLSSTGIAMRGSINFAPSSVARRDSA